RNSYHDLKGKEKVDDLASLTRKLYELKTQIKAERVAHVSEKVAKNKCKLEGVLLYLADMLRTKEHYSKGECSSCDMLSFRMNNPLAELKPQQTFDLDSPDIPEVIYPTAMLPLVEKIPRSITWVPSDSNKLMAEDQPDEQKHQFSEAEKRMIRFVISQEYEPTEDVIQLLTKFIGGTTSEIHEAFTIIKTENEEMVNGDVTVPTGDQGLIKDLDKSLADEQDSFDALFCRQCLTFDCRRHMIRKPVITPAERAPSIVNQENERPCSDQCYLHLKLQEYPERNRASFIGSEPAIIEETVWKRLEKDLYSKGQEIFGKNSCLIARNTLLGLKNCIQVYKYMNAGHEGPSNACSTNDHEEPQSSVRRKNKAKRQKHFGKSVARRPTLRGSANGNRAKQYTPCDCKSGCGKDCPCLKSSNCCARKAAGTGIGDVTVPSLDAEASNAHAMLLAVSVTQMCVVIVGSGNMVSA
ncbi:histone-lysine N-methyltransferase EZA1, partial [Tanacetum coccineum]